MGDPKICENRELAESTGCSLYPAALLKPPCEPQHNFDTPRPGELPVATGKPSSPARAPEPGLLFQVWSIGHRLPDDLDFGMSAVYVRLRLRAFRLSRVEFGNRGSAALLRKWIGAHQHQHHSHCHCEEASVPKGEHHEHYYPYLPLYTV